MADVRSIQVVTPEQAGVKTFTTDQISTIKNTVARGANDSELKMLLCLASKYRLDPFAKEIWFIKMNGQQPLIMTSRDGYLKIANENPHFKGMKSDVVYPGDKFARKGNDIEHSYDLAARNGKAAPLGAYALVYRDDRDMPTYYFAPMNNYNTGRQTWRQYPHAMILKVAEAMALKRAFSLSGLVTSEEMDARQEVSASFGGDDDNPPTVQAVSDEPDEKPDMKALQIAVWNKYKKFYGNRDKAKEAIVAIVGDKPSESWTVEDLNKLAERLLEQQDEYQKFCDGIDAIADEPEPEAYRPDEDINKSAPDDADEIAN